ncbi:hypothetical protein ACX0G9_06715 [Flavitalea flava]
MPNPKIRPPARLLMLVVFLLILITEVRSAPGYLFSLSDFTANTPESRNFLPYRDDTELIKTPETGKASLLKNKKENETFSRHVHREKNSDLVILLPNAARIKYKVRFFDEENNFLFEIKQLRDSVLIVEKFNFLHTGLFQYELYKENALVERNTFLIKNE